jgi:hypothetical protein
MVAICSTRGCVSCVGLRARKGTEKRCRRRTPLMTLGTVKIPTLKELQAIASELGFTMSEADLAIYLRCLEPDFSAYDLVDRLPDELPPGKYPIIPPGSAHQSRSM